MPQSLITDTSEQLSQMKSAEGHVKTIIAEHGLDFVLRICAAAALEREAAFRAVRAFTGITRS
jgi:hypothetical protein